MTIYVHVAIFYFSLDNFHLVVTSYQVKLSRKRTFHHFMSTGATEKSLHFISLLHCSLNLAQLEATEAKTLLEEVRTKLTNELVRMYIEISQLLT